MKNNFFKAILSLMLVLSLLLPVFASAELDEDDDYSSEDLVIEDIVLDENGNNVLMDDETGEGIILSASDKDVIDELTKQIEVDELTDPDSMELNPNLPDNVINILLLGLDVRGTSDKKMLSDLDQYAKRADVQIILSINKDNGSIKLSSIARNTYVEIPGRKNKTLIANSYGHANYENGEYKSWTDTPEVSVRTVNHNFEMNIQYYVSINFYGVASIIESLGGIDLELTKTEARAINTYLSKRKIYNKKGEQISHGAAIANTYDDKKGNREQLKEKAGVQHLDGIQALIYARLRSIDSDFVRTQRTRHLLDALLQSVAMKQKNHELDLVNLFSDSVGYMKTNMNLWDMLTLAIDVMNTSLLDRVGVTDSLVDEFRIPMDGTWHYDTVNGSSVTTIDRQANTEALHEFIYGKYYPANP